MGFKTAMYEIYDDNNGLYIFMVIVTRDCEEGAPSEQGTGVSPVLISHCQCMSAPSPSPSQPLAFQHPSPVPTSQPSAQLGKLNPLRNLYIYQILPYNYPLRQARRPPQKYHQILINSCALKCLSSS